jgi:ribosomal protein S18 acetylase RimI-like enzyme
MASIRILDLTDDDTFRLVPPCADPRFDHRTCDYWEDADRGSKAARSSWLQGSRPPERPAPANNPFAPDRPAVPNPFAADRPKASNPFAPPERTAPANPFALDPDPLADNPFAPSRPARADVGADTPPKLRLLLRGLGVFGSYAKVLLVDDEPAAYAQFGPLSAYPRAQRTRELYPQLPEAPLPAVISCIASTADARGHGHASMLADAVCDDLAARGFSAIEAYPEVGADPNATSAASVDFWRRLGFTVAVDDDRFPVVRLEL